MNINEIRVYPLQLDNNPIFEYGLQRIMSNEDLGSRIVSVVTHDCCNPTLSIYLDKSGGRDILRLSSSNFLKVDASLAVLFIIKQEITFLVLQECFGRFH